MRKNSLALDRTDGAKQLAGSLVTPTGEGLRKRSWWESFLKRFIDVVVSLFVLVVGFPFFLSIALLIKLTSQGPVFFKQKRVREKGHVFNLYKFRTMKTGSDDTPHREFTRHFIQGRTPHSRLDENSSGIYKLTNDPRVTAVGSFLRKTSRRRGRCRRKLPRRSSSATSTNCSTPPCSSPRRLKTWRTSSRAWRTGLRSTAGWPTGS